MSAPNPLRESQALHAQGETEKGQRVAFDPRDAGGGRAVAQVRMDLASRPYTGWRAGYARWLLARLNQNHPVQRLRALEVVLSREPGRLGGVEHRDNSASKPVRWSFSIGEGPNMSSSKLRACAASLCFAAFSCTPGIINIQPTSGTPAYVSSNLFPGTQVNVTGVQICDAATKVDLGADTTVATVETCTPNADKATTTVQRLSTDGPVRLNTGTTLPAAPMASSQSFSVRTMRNQNGFNFSNSGNIPQLTVLDYVEFFGADQFMVQVDPCAPFGGHCAVPTGLPDPIALAFAGITMAVMNGNGECFGFVLGSQRMMWGEVPIHSFDPAASTVWTVPATAPGLQHFLQLQHLGQLSGEFLNAYVTMSAFNGIDPMAFQNTRNGIHSSLAGVPTDFPMLAIKMNGEGHVLLGYDLEGGTPANGGVGNGDYFIYVYDPNQPFTLAENTDFASHQALEQTRGRIHVFPNNTWSFNGSFATNPQTWTGTMDGLVPVSHRRVPLIHPTMPAISDLLGSLVFASGAVQTLQITDSAGNPLLKPDGTVDHTPGKSIPEAATLPALGDGKGQAREPLFVFGKAGAYRHRLRMQGEGPYQDGAVTNGFTTLVGSVSRAGQDGDDQLTFDGPGRALRFATAAAEKPIAVQLAAHAESAATHVALLQTTGFKGAGERVAFTRDAQALQFEHAADGAPAVFRFTLGVVQRDGAVATFASPPDLRVVAGDQVTVTPSDWSRLGAASVKVVTTHASRVQDTRTLTQPAPVAVSSGPSADGRVTVVVNAAPLGLSPLSTVEMACAGEKPAWVTAAKFSGAPGPQTAEAGFSLSTRGCAVAKGATLTLLVRALDAQGGTPMIAPLTVKIP